MGDSNAIKQFLRCILVPVVRYCIRRSLRLNEVIELTKELFVELAEDELRYDNQVPSASRVSIMTGVHRKDVARLMGRDTSYQRKNVSDLLTRVLGLWQTDPRYTTKGGRPRTLPYAGENGFASLVESLSKELKPQSVIGELLRISAVRQGPRGFTLVKESLTPQGDVEQISHFLENDSTDLIHAVDENLFSSPEVLNLHLTTEYSEIPQARESEIRQWFLEQGSAFHKRVRRYLSAIEREANSEENTETMRVAFASFSVTQQSRNKE